MRYSAQVVIIFIIIYDGWLFQAVYRQEECAPTSGFLLHDFDMNVSMYLSAFGSVATPTERNRKCI